MLPTFVALVPLEKQTSISSNRLREVAAALQIQVARDLGPVWGVSAVVSAFGKLEDIPSGYLPLAVAESSLPAHRRGFHFVMGGLPFGVVRYGAKYEWTVAASHELIEMLCNPFALRTALAPSVADAKAAQVNSPGAAPAGGNDVIKGDGGAYTPQGFVNYIVEVCDPCEDSTYEINGVTVSDFVTPSYYATPGTSPGPYSFIQSVKTQLGVLQGGSISWRPLLPQALVYQAEAPRAAKRRAPAATAGGSPSVEVGAAQLTISEVVDGSSGLSVASQKSPARAATLGPNRTYHTARNSWASAGNSVRADLKAMLKYLEYSTKHEPPSVDEIIAFLEDVTEPGRYRKFKADPAPKLSALGLTAAPQQLTNVPTRAKYLEILKYLRQQKKVASIFGPDLSGEDTALWLCMQIG